MTTISPALPSGVVLGQPNTLAGGSTNQSFLTGATVNLLAFGGNGNNAFDNSPALTAAIAQCVALGGGSVWVPAGIYAMASTVAVPTNVKIVGAGKGGWHDAGSVFNVGATTFVWIGGNGGTMFSLIAPAGGNRIVGSGLIQCCLVGGVFPFSTIAAQGIQAQSVAFSTFDVTLNEFSGQGLNFDVVAGLAEDGNNEGNDLDITFRFLNSTGTVLRLGGTNGVANTSQNQIRRIYGQYYNGMVVDWVCADNNTVGYVDAYRAPGGTGTLMTFRGQRTSGGEFARQNCITWLTEQTGGGTIIVEGTNTSGVVGASVQNRILFFDYGDDNPNIVIGTGGQFFYSSNKQPLGTQFAAFTLLASSTGQGVFVDDTGVNRGWGNYTAASSGKFTINLVALGNYIGQQVQNVVCTPIGTTAGALCAVSNFTQTGFDLAVSVAGEYFYQWIGV